MIDADIRSFLLAQPAVAALVSTRVEKSKAAQGTPFPRIVLTQVGQESLGHLTGPGNHGAGTWQIDCQARTAGEVVELAQAVFDALEGHIGTMGARHAAVEMVNVVDDYDPDEGADSGTYRILQDYRIVWEAQ